MSEVKKESKVNNEEVRLKLLECRNWIRSNYENTCLTNIVKPNGEWVPDESFEALLNDTMDFASFNVLPLCGCGCYDETVEIIRDYLGIVKFRTDDPMKNWDKAREMFRERFKCPDECFDPLFQFMVYTLNDRELLDHGSSVTGSWATDLGKLVWYIFDIYLRNEYPEEYEDKPKEETKSE